MKKMKGLSFVVGTSNFKVETIKDHEMSIGHIQSKDGWFATRQCGGEVSCPHKVSRAREDAGAVFNVHIIGKKGQPFTDYVWMCEQVLMLNMCIIKLKL